MQYIHMLKINFVLFFILLFLINVKITYNQTTHLYDLKMHSTVLIVLCKLQHCVIPEQLQFLKKKSITIPQSLQIKQCPSPWKQLIYFLIQ